MIISSVHLNNQSSIRRFAVTAKSYSSFDVVELNLETLTDPKDGESWVRGAAIEFFCIKGTGKNLAAALKAATGK